VELPLVVIGAGPQGLAAGAHLVERGLELVVLEAGASAGAAVAEWGHVRLFSPWSELVDPASERLLAAAGWERPHQAYPTGAEWVERYLAPLAEALGRRVRYRSRVAGVARKGRDLSVDSGRAGQPFSVQVSHADGREEQIEAKAVIDASGTWASPAPAGAHGLPALGGGSGSQCGIALP